MEMHVPKIVSIHVYHSKTYIVGIDVTYKDLLNNNIIKKTIIKGYFIFSFAKYKL